MLVIIINANEFRLIPEMEAERINLKDAQKSALKNPRVAYAGRCEGADRHIRFNVGGKVRLTTNGRSERWRPRIYETEGGTTITIRPHGENADDAFKLLKYYGICNSKITGEIFADGLVCKAEPSDAKPDPSKPTKRRRS